MSEAATLTPEQEREQLEKLYAVLHQGALPPHGAEFQIHYFFDGTELGGEEILRNPHTNVTAVSEGLKVTVNSPDAKVVMRHQKKPIKMFEYEPDGLRDRRMLVVELNGVFIHILGPHVVVAEEKYNVGQIVEAMNGEN